ncbi:MAG: lysylphosphatidylglycerol synthase domain-containing protein [Woeseia sp.]
MWLKITYALLTVVLVAAVELTVGWSRLLEPWTRASPSAILGAALLVLLTYVIRSARLFRFYRECNDIRPCIRLFLLHNVFVNFLPLHSGEVSFPILMKRYFAISVNRSVSGLLWLRYLDFHTLILIALAALWLATPWRWVAPLLVVWVVLPIFAVILWETCGVVFDKHDNRFSALIAGVLKTLPKSRSRLFESWGWTTLNWGVKLVSFAWILTIFAPIDFAESVFGAAGGELSTVLPINPPAGIGSYEAGVFAAVTPLGVKAHHAIIGGINLHLFVLGMALVGGLLTFLIPRGLAPQSTFVA